MSHTVGSLIRARGREWVVLPDSTDDFLLVRPLVGRDAEATAILTELEPVTSATFPLPDPTQPGDFLSAKLLRDALRLGLRSTAGPFRSLAHIAITPRPYQLVPLLMALKQETVRLLIADDVGIGKTIEAALIARELLDVGTVSRLAVLCPPHLAEQWQSELRDKFHIEAELVLSSTAARLERGLPQDRTIFDEHPFVVVSTDFIKSDRRRDEFLRTAPEFVIVDEAHTCVEQSGGRSSHQRHRLVQGLADDVDRHLVLVTATPHSGKTDAFRSLIGLLDADFLDLPENLGGEHNRRHRERLAEHLVQRRRADIQKYQIGNPFPTRHDADPAPTYLLSDEYAALFNAVMAFARETVLEPGTDTRTRRIRWWSVLGLLRALASSPAAAAETLRQRSLTADAADAAEADRLGEEHILDITVDDTLDSSDTVFGADPDNLTDSGRRRLRRFAEAAEALRGDADTKLAGLVEIVRGLLDDGHHPIVFCRFIQTAEYVAAELESRLSDVDVRAVTGRVPSTERERRVEELAEAPRRVLVATDCLSEGINLQHAFTSVIHYDLPWNPTRLEQREGRVDRFGQAADEVRIVAYCGTDNVIDPAVRTVLMEKHLAIRKDLGISIPVPGSTADVMEAVGQAILEQAEAGSQLSLALSDDGMGAEHELISAWTDAAEREKASRSLFAHTSIRPDEVAVVHTSAERSLGGADSVRQFTLDAMRRLGATVTEGGDNRPDVVDTSEIAASIREHIGLDDSTLRLRFADPVTEGQTLLVRSHPLVAGLAQYVLGAALDGQTHNGRPVAARCGVTRTTAVDVRTTLLVVRHRFQLATTRSRRTSEVLVEDAVTVAFARDPRNPEWLPPDAVAELLSATPSGNVSPQQASEFLTDVIAAAGGWMPTLAAGLVEAAERLHREHISVREAARESRDAAETVTVTPLPPVDVLGIHVLLPAAP